MGAAVSDATPNGTSPEGSSPAGSGADGRGPEEVARSFVEAVAWGEHHTVWELLSQEGRTLVLRLGATRGMDQALAARLRDGTAATAEREEFLTDLINGLRADLAGNELDNLETELDTTLVGATSVRVILVSPLPAALSLPGLPFATVELTDEAQGWRIDRMVPRTSK